MAFAARDEDEARQIRDSLDADFAAGRLAIVNGWLVDTSNIIDDGSGPPSPEPLIDLVAVDPAAYDVTLGDGGSAL